MSTGPINIISAKAMLAAQSATIATSNNEILKFFIKIFPSVPNQLRTQAARLPTPSTSVRRYYARELSFVNGRQNSRTCPFLLTAARGRGGRALRGDQLAVVGRWWSLSA